MPADQSQRQLLSLLTVRKENLDAEMHQVPQPGQNTDLAEWRCVMQPDRKRLHTLIICNIFCDEKVVFGAKRFSLLLIAFNDDKNTFVCDDLLSVLRWLIGVLLQWSCLSPFHSVSVCRVS